MLQKIYNILPVWMQNVMCSVKGWQISRRRYGRGFDVAFNQLKNRAVNPNVELNKFLQMARFVPAYASVFENAGDASLQDFPIINKEYVKAHFNDFVNKDYKGDRIVIHTSGTTGSSLEVPQSLGFEHKQWATWWRYREELGIKFGTWYGWFGCADMVVPAKQKTPPYWRVDVAGRRVMFGTYHLNSENVELYAEEIIRRGLTWLHGHASRLCYFSRLITEKGVAPITNVKFITTGSENLLASHIADIQKAFPKALIRTHYGMTEGVANFSQTKDGSWRVDEDFAKVEFIPVEPENPSRCRIIGTNFSNPAFPLIRYDIGDVAIVDWSHGVPRVLGIEGRVNECITLDNGMLINSMLLYDIFADINHVIEAQVCVTGGLQLEILVVRGSQYSKREEASIQRNILKYFSDEIGVKITYCDSIMRSKSGKFIAVLDKRRIIG